jgi:hypothetical protein
MLRFSGYRWSLAATTSDGNSELAVAPLKALALAYGHRIIGD